MKSILVGAGNKQVVEDRQVGRKGRLPVTIAMLKLLKCELNLMQASKYFKRLTWAAASICFFGALRVHEILCRRPSSFDPDFTLLVEDVNLVELTVQGESVRVLQLRLKSPKEDRVGRNVIVDVYASEGAYCPVRAFQKWWGMRVNARRGTPAFVLEDGMLFTGKLLNQTLKDCLQKHVPAGYGAVSSHSFRSGIASLMGQLGYTDEEIKAVGRWSSNSFEAYLKLPRTKRVAMARNIARVGLQ